MQIIPLTNQLCFSFENSVCNDYITEKFFKVFDYDMVPIVFGTANYSKVAPAKSYLNVDDFETLEIFVAHIQYLERNATAYAEYFEWKSHFKVNFFSKVFCHLCQALNDETSPVKTYSNMYQWWVDDAKCVGEKLIPV